MTARAWSSRGPIHRERRGLSAGRCNPCRCQTERICAHSAVAHGAVRRLARARRRQLIGDPTEGALLGAGQKGGLDPARTGGKAAHRRDSPSTRRTSSWPPSITPGRPCEMWVKGAPDVLLARAAVLAVRARRRSTMPGATRIRARMNTLAGQALRVLAVAGRLHSSPRLRPGRRPDGLGAGPGP
jgi:magnesium-transporting ATPase (P-type)